MIKLDRTKPYSTHDQGSNAQTRFMQDGKKFDINGNLLGPDGRELDAIEDVEIEPEASEDVEALFAEPAFTEEVVETEPVVEPAPEIVKPKSRKPKAKPALEKEVEEQTEIDDLA